MTRPKKVNRTLLKKLIVMSSAFLLLAVLSYAFMGMNVHNSIERHATSVHELTEYNIITSLWEYEATLNGCVSDIRRMLARGDTEEQLQAYLEEISHFSFMDGNEISGTTRFFSYFETLPGGPKLIHSSNWSAPENYVPEEQAWYRLAIEAGGGIIETVPQRTDTGETQFIYGRRVFDKMGRPIAIVCMIVQLDSMGQRIVKTSLNQGGYGILMNQDGTILFHPNQGFRGRSMYEPDIPFSPFALFIHSGYVHEMEMVSYKGEESVAFFSTLSNGWHLGLVTPKAQYYRDIVRMGMVIGVLAVVFAAVFIYIMTKMDAARERSDEENRHKSAFLANMSHEIRTPINAIVGMTAIGRTAGTQERMRHCFMKIDDASRHLLSIINDILDLSKIEANKIELSPTDFLFEKMLRQVVSILQFRLDEKHQKLHVTVDKDIPQVIYADDYRLSHVITNLLSNAAKFSPENSNIYLHAYFLGESKGYYTLQIEVIDEGIGISREQQAELFKPFQQAEASTTRRFGGTGLGLYISKSIVEMMNGTIWVESEEGFGSAFVFIVRVKRGDEARCEDSGSMEGGGGEDEQGIDGLFASRRILLADDVEINREIVITQLEPTGIAVDCAENGMQAVEMFRRDPEKYDLILMDIQMPELDGYDATRSIRALKTTGAADIPIIAMTANVFKEDVERCLEAGMNAHLGKPIEFEDMLRVLKAFLA